MKLDLIRNVFTDYSTIGDLLIDGKYFCFTLEDVDRQRQKDGSIIPWTRDLKIPKETAIPYGTYEIITNHSNRFKRVMPLILNVPDFSGIRFHNGITAKNTEGCQLVGYEKGIDCIGRSDEAFGHFMTKLLKGLLKGRVHIKISAG